MRKNSDIIDNYSCLIKQPKKVQKAKYQEYKPAQAHEIVQKIELERTINE